MREKRHTAATAFGDIEYETVVCDSCEQEVAKEHANQFVIAGEYRERYGTDKVKDVKASGWACPYCTDEGPISHPGTRYRGVPKILQMLGVSIVAVAHAIRQGHQNWLAEMRNDYERGWHGLFLISGCTYVILMGLLTLTALSVVSVVLSAVF